MIAISVANMRAAPFSSNRSRTIEREITMPTQPPSACRKRKPIRAWMSVASAQPSEAPI